MADALPRSMSVAARLPACPAPHLDRHGALFGPRAAALVALELPVPRAPDGGLLAAVIVHAEEARRRLRLLHDVAVRHAELGPRHALAHQRLAEIDAVGRAD